MIEFQSDDVGSAIASLPGTVDGVEITDTFCDLTIAPTIIVEVFLPVEYLYQGRTKLLRICNISLEIQA
jgi:hypothetical protein